MFKSIMNFIKTKRQPLVYTISGDEALDIREFLDACASGSKQLQSEYLLWDYLHANYPATRAGNWKIEAMPGKNVRIIEQI